MFLGSFKGVLREVSKFQRRFNGVTESVKCVSRKFYKKFQGCFKNLSMKFVLQFRCSMNLIAATRAEGGLVSLGLYCITLSVFSYFCFTLYRVRVSCPYIIKKKKLNTIYFSSSPKLLSQKFIHEKMDFKENLKVQRALVLSAGLIFQIECCKLHCSHCITPIAFCRDYILQIAFCRIHFSA